MLPPFGSSPYARHSIGMLPELQELVREQEYLPNRPRQSGPPERVEEWKSVERYLRNGFFHNTGYAIDQFVEKFKYLNTTELGEIIDAIYALEDEVHDIISHMSECLNITAYCEMVLRSRDPEIVVHHDLIKRQLERSNGRYERYCLAWQHFHREESKLWAIWSEETHRARDLGHESGSESDEPGSDKV
ncbi:hypothetical protein DFH28DRAFT_1118858 [Melampsora americana]|nr:hypothetical protein DFH28DRAFT_1118858 [Melampsora americana]